MRLHPEPNSGLVQSHEKKLNSTVKWDERKRNGGMAEKDITTKKIRQGPSNS
jgi:hypothetical protein